MEPKPMEEYHHVLTYLSEMSNKENAVVMPTGGELSAEQRARISQSFRAAKALLARKRPRFESETASNHALSNRKSGDEKETNGIKRLPLSQISTNISTPVSLKDCKFSKTNGDDAKNGVKNEILVTPVRQSGCSSISCLGDASSYENKLITEGFGMEKVGLSLENRSILNSGVNQLRPNDRSNDLESNPNSNSIKPLDSHDMNDSILTFSLSDDFDESILEQIDEVCEQKSSGNSQRGNSATDRMENEIVIKSCEEDNAITNINVTDETLKSKEILDSAGDEACGVRGLGKSENILTKICLRSMQSISPSNILAMTFTTAAAAEMRERIGAVAGKAAAKELMISTFHSFSLQLCRLHAEKLGRTPDFLIYGHGQQRRAIIEAVRLLEDGKRKANHEPCKFTELSDINSPKQFKDKSKKWLKFVTQAKAAGKSPDDFRKMGDETGAIILQNYNDILKSCNALDYHDFISCSVKLLTDFPEVFECQESWKAIVIDEFQDTSAMQYGLLQILASHKRITIVGDEDQVRLNKNYRSTRCIVEAASFLIRNNLKRCISKDVMTDNSSGSKITIKECCNEDAQCAFVVDKILEIASDGSSAKCSYGNIAVLYRRQVTGKIFQTAFRDRKIPFNIHGVAFYRKKVIEHIDKVSTVRKCSFISAASDIFSAKISGTFKRSQLTQGRKVLHTLDMISKLVYREQSISAVITSVTNMIPQKYLLEQRAVLDVDGGKLLNEDNDLRSLQETSFQVLQPSRFLREIPHHLLETQEELISVSSEKTCPQTVKEAPLVSVTLRTESPENNTMQQVAVDNLSNEASKEPSELENYSSKDRAVVSHLFHQWAKKPAFHDPKRLLNKEHFQKLRIESAMNSSEPTPKQVKINVNMKRESIPFRTPEQLEHLSALGGDRADSHYLMLRLDR
ncbi:hypothetical protein DH2020_048408 [Rehmannia glutinosa]|uniref:DNA 3'-5' helicase n=1 Tax=Rehmannia glutinosa TaxID=99300 RepID=A0ABR0U5Q9_REHGL